jgi:hypothetical protein
VCPDKEVLNDNNTPTGNSILGHGECLQQETFQRWTVLTGETLCNIEETLGHLLQKSLRRLSQQSVLPVTCVHQATKQLKLQLYRFQAVHQLQQWDMAA